jgi:carboxypeptidase Taq
MTSSAYDTLSQTWQRLHHFKHLQSLAGWDSSAMMPPQGQLARANAMAEMDTLLHRTLCDPSLGPLIDSARNDPLTADQAANLREMQREWQAAVALPESLVQRQALATSRCEHAWRKQRPANDWPPYLANLKEVVALAREESVRRADSTGLSPYDALLDRYEPGMRSAELDRLFGDLQQWLPGLVQQVLARQAREPVTTPQGPFPKAAQRSLSLEVMGLLGFNFESGRLDESAHPFSGGVPEDVRLTTRYREDDFLQSLMGTIHETGHARYEQNLPREWLGQPLAEARSMGIHESQSLSFEMQLGRSRPFAELLSPRLAGHFGAQAAFEPEALQRMLTRVEAGFIRVDADELTYPAHVILRYGIERDLIEGRIETEDIPARWDEGMATLLGLDTRGNYKDGCMQDVHWGAGLIGYFPCYTLGAMYAAQWFATLRAAVPDLDARIAGGDLEPVFHWLRDNIWLHASRWPTGELVQRASGSGLDPAHFRRHLETRYLG